jgi:hypothetical protein
VLYSQARRLADQVADKHSFLHNVFSLRLDPVPSAILTHPDITRLPKPTPEDTSETHEAIQATWRLQVLATLYAIWRWRTDAEDQAAMWTIAQARAYHDGCLKATHDVVAVAFVLTMTAPLPSSPGFRRDPPSKNKMYCRSGVALVLVAGNSFSGSVLRNSISKATEV